jgi:phosphate transport system permease protein
MNRRRVIDLAFTALVRLCALLTVGAVVSIFGFVAREAAPVFARDAPPLRALVAPASNGAASQRFVWQPVGRTPRYNLAPLAFGSAKVASLALLLATPVGLLAGCALAFVVSSRTRRRLKPVVELLAGVPSIIYGIWGLFILAPLLQQYVQPLLIKTGLPIFAGPPLGIGIFTAGIVLALMVIPFTASVMRDVFETVPAVLKESAYGIGCTTWEVMKNVVLPYTRVGVIGGIMLGLGRALGETMAVTFVIGNANRLSPSLFAPGNSIASTLANEFAEADPALHVPSLFALGLILFFITVVVLMAAKWLTARGTRKAGI